MLVNDLRIGNWIIPLEDDKPMDDCYWRISTIARNYVFVELMTEITKGITEIKGIDLTEEILLKCGFENKPNSFDYILDDWIELKLEDDDWSFPSFDVFVKGTYVTCLSQLHELQNFYYSLNYKELDIKFHS